MADPETLIVKGAIIITTLVVMARFVLHEIRNLRDDFNGKRRRR